MKIETITVPSLGESATEVTVVEWLRSPGEWVDEGEPLVAVETDKVDTELPSPFGGTLREVLADAGATLPIGGALATIDVAD